MSSPPLLPEPAHHTIESMLSRKFGKEIANYFSGSPLNRISFLRSDHKFLSAAFAHPSTRFLLLNNLAPLAHDPSRLAYATHPEIQPLFPENPYAKSEPDLIATYNSTVTIPQLLFLGLDERVPNGFEWTIYKGSPYFALDLTPRGGSPETATQLSGLIANKEQSGLQFLQGRTHMTLPAPEAAIYAQARALLDWNARNPFCGQCGQPTLSINAGAKRTCPPTDLAPSSTSTTTPNPSPSPNPSPTTPPPQPTPRLPCPTRHGVSNLSFPRTDPTVIMAVLSSAGTHILLGRQKHWPPHWYSTLAGFVEPAESIEEAVRREVWEEAGITLGRVVIHSSQPWPYPANLMIGAIGQAVAGGEEVMLQHDPELEDARWVPVEEVREAMRVWRSGLGEGDVPGEGYREGGLRLPPRTAIANRLLDAVVNGLLAGEVEI